MITASAIAPALVETATMRDNPGARPDLIPVGRFGAVDEAADDVARRYGVHRAMPSATARRAPHLLAFTNRRQKSRTERANVQSSVSGTDRDGAPTQLSIVYSSGAPPTNA